MRTRPAAADPVVGAAAGAALCSVLSWLLPASQAGELASEAACWALLPVLVVRARAVPWSETGSASGGAAAALTVPRSQTRLLAEGAAGATGPKNRPSSVSLWTVAAALGVACCFRAEVGPVWLYPVLTPLLLVAESTLRPASGALGESGPSSFWSSTKAVRGAAAIAIAGIMALRVCSLAETALTIIPTAALLVFYLTLIPRLKEGPCVLGYINIDEQIAPLSVRILAILAVTLGVQTFAFGAPDLDVVVPALSLGLCKALAWYFHIQVARETSWSVATAISSFGMLASRDPFIQPSEFRAVAPVVASFFATGQIVSLMPAQTKGRSLLWFLILFAICPYISNRLAIRRAQSSALHSLEHPVELLMRTANVEFELMLERQSRNYSAAVTEYQHRYGVEPPAGFKAWYEFAVANKSPIIDEFDAIYDAIWPFWRLSGEAVAQIIKDAYDDPGSDLWRCTSSGAAAQIGCTHLRRQFDRHIGDVFQKLLGDLGGLLPSTQFLVNHLDEPRVLIPPASLKEEVGKLTVTTLDESPTWNAVTKFCGAGIRGGDTSRSRTEGIDPHNHGLPLVTNRTSGLDLCVHPEYRNMHGLFQSPASFRLIQGPVPVLSTGTISTMSDILMPSPAYLDPEFVYDAAHDMPWESKADQLYWAGSTTGGVSSLAKHGDWRHFHRQRFISLAQDLPPRRRRHIYLHEAAKSSRAKKATPTRSAFLNSRHYAVFPTRVFQCAHPRPCRAQRARFRTLPWQPPDAALGSKLVFDLDGNGVSGRFRKLLASRSLVLKQTLLREWHDERLAPWVHYVPVSMGMGELPELVGWFLETERGRKAAREVADAGAEWVRRAVREVDMKIYLWRLLLEMARLADVGRGPLTPVGGNF